MSKNFERKNDYLNEIKYLDYTQDFLNLMQIKDHMSIGLKSFLIILINLFITDRMKEYLNKCAQYLLLDYLDLDQL